MSRYTRGEFLGLGAGLVEASLGAPQADGLRQEGGRAAAQADLVVLNARVYTQDARWPRAEAFAVKDGRVLAVGVTGDIRNLGGSTTREIDAAGMTVTPGFSTRTRTPTA